MDSNSKRGFGFTGFSLSGTNKKSRFDDDDEEEQRKPPRFLRQEEQNRTEANNNNGNDDEIDPLDAFMNQVHATVAREAEQPKTQKFQEQRADFEQEDSEEVFVKAKINSENDEDDSNSDNEVYAAASSDIIEYDSDDNPIVPGVGTKKKIEPLPPMDHSLVNYKEFEKNFYAEDPLISSMTEDEVLAYRREMDIHISGVDPVRPVKNFLQFGFDEVITKEITRQNYTEPTPIQKQAVPVALSGRDIIGIAKTGSGKTAAFIWPMLVHIMDQPQLEKGDGPIAIISAPTRELAHQIYLEAKKFARGYGIRVVAVYGGVNKYEQTKELKQGAEVVVGTPGRLIDMVKLKALSLLRVTYLVLDEADRMFDMGFEPQVRSIVGHIRPDRQTLLFSATFKGSVEKLARDILMDPIRIHVGQIGEANEDIRQVVEVLNEETEKWDWILKHLTHFVEEGSVIIFVGTKLAAEDLAKKLVEFNFSAVALHGDKDQSDRASIMNSFKKQEIPILVATDVAARGLDVKSIKNVVNYDCARDIDSHVHRIGRTGRAGELGMAYTLMTPSDKDSFAADLVRNLEAANQAVPPSLIEFAMGDQRFRAQRRQAGIGMGRGRGNSGRGGSTRGRGRERGSSSKRVTPGIGFVATPPETKTASSNYETKTNTPSNYSNPSNTSNYSSFEHKSSSMGKYHTSFVKASTSSSGEDGGSWAATQSTHPTHPTYSKLTQSQSHTSSFNPPNNTHSNFESHNTSATQSNRWDRTEKDYNSSRDESVRHGYNNSRDSNYLKDSSNRGSQNQDTKYDNNRSSRDSRDNRDRDRDRDREGRNNYRKY